MQFIASFSCNSLPTGLGCGNMYVTDLLAGCPQGPQLTWTAMSMHNEHTHTYDIRLRNPKGLQGFGTINILQKEYINFQHAHVIFPSLF